MSQPLAQTRFSVADYLAWEPQQTQRHDYFRGEVLAMTGGTLRHNQATLAAASTWKQHLKGSPCRVFSGDVKVAVNSSSHWFYPDVVVTCSAHDLHDLSAVQITEPILVLEVLSPSTAAYDRGEKFLSLQRLGSLQEYALLDAEAPRLELFRRNASERFEYFFFEGTQSAVELHSIGWNGCVANLLD